MDQEIRSTINSWDLMKIKVLGTAKETNKKQSQNEPSRKQKKNNQEMGYRFDKRFIKMRDTNA